MTRKQALLLSLMAPFAISQAPIISAGLLLDLGILKNMIVRYKGKELVFSADEIWETLQPLYLETYCDHEHLEDGWVRYTCLKRDHD